MATKSDNAIDVKLGYISRDIANLTEMVEILSKDVKKNYVSQAEFKPVKALVYGLVGLTLTSVFGALVALVMK